MDFSHSNAASDYESLTKDRQTYLDRARDCALLTIPRIFPKEGHNQDTEIITPYNSVGSRGINNLASSMLLSLLPPQSSPFFRLVTDESYLQSLPPEDRQTVEDELDVVYSDLERKVMRKIEVSNFRPQVFEGLKQLLIGGNALFHLENEGTLRHIHLEHYALKRDPSGNLLHLIVKETIALDALPEDLVAAIDPVELEKKKADAEVDLYTEAKLNAEGKFRVVQSAFGKEIPGTDSLYKPQDLPFLPISLYLIMGESYGRSLVEEYFGDLHSLEALSQSLVEFSAAASKILFMVSANGTTRKTDLANKPSGSIVTGNAADVTVLQMEKFADFRITKETVDSIQQRMNHVFLLTTDMIRNAERVTAEEVRLTQQQIEKQHGAAYAMLAVTFQLPLVRMLLRRMTADQELPALPDKIVEPMIVTGVDAMGRGNDLNKLDAFVGGLHQVLTPEVANQRINIGEYMKRRAAALGIDHKNLVVTDEELQQRQAEQQQAAMANTAAGPVAKEAANAAFQPPPESA